MPNIKENRAKVYGALTKMGFSGIGADESEFSALMDKEENRVKVYDALSRKGFKGIGKDYDEFSSLMYAPEEVAKKETVEPYKFGETIQGMYKPMEQATGMMPVEGSIHKTENGYARTNIPHQTEEFSSLENAREAERMQQRENALAAYKSAYNRLEKPGEVDEKTLIEWGNDMTKAPTEQKDLYKRVTGADATSRVDLDMLMRSIDETAKNLDSENAKELAVYLSMSPERQASLAPEEREKYEGWIKDVRKKEAVKGTDELFTRIADLKEKQRVSDIKAYNEYEKNRGVGGWVKDALLGIPVAEAPHMKGKIPSSGFDISPEGVASKEANDALTAAGRYYNKSQKMIQAAQSGNFFQAMDDALNDMDTWSPEVILQDNLAIQRVANKYEEEGEGALTENEKALLDALAMNAAVTELYGGDISSWTNAGTMIGQMAPFMIEMVLNPLSGLSRKAAAAVTKRAVKKYGAEALKKGLKNVTLGATRGLAKAGGAVVGGTGMALTTGLPAVAADTQKRMLGEATYGYEDGKVKYTGHTEGEGLLEAAGGAIASRAIDNATEMFGAEYASKLMKGALKPLAKTKVGGWVDNLANSRFGKAAANFSEKTNWNGPIEEFLEEMHAGLLGAAAGEHKLSEFFTKDNIATIAIGVSVPGVAMSTMNTVQGIKDGAFKAGAQERWKMENADAIATRLWQNPAEWKDLRNSLTVGTLEETEEKLKEVYNDKNLTPEQKVRAFEYAIYNLQYRTARGVAEGYSENAKKTIDPMLRDIYGTSFAEYVSPRQANKAFKAMEEAGKNAVQSLGLQDVSIEDWLGDRTVEEATRGNKTQAEAVQAYLNAKADFEGKRDRFQFERERAYTEADNSIDNMSNNGMVYSTEMDGEEVFITGGNVVLNENGTVDIENSSEVLYVRRPDNTVRSVACENIPGEVTAESAENLKAARRAEIDEKWKADFEAAEAEPASQGVDQVAPVAQQNPNDFTLELEGEQYHVQVEDGVVKVDGEPVEWDAQTLADARAKAGVASEEVKAETEVADTTTEEVELPDVYDFFRLDGKNYAVVAKNADGSVGVMVDGKRAVLPAGTDYSTAMPTGKSGEILFTKMPAERTLEYFSQRVPNEKARAQMIENNRKQAESALKKFDKEPNVGTDPDAYEATMKKWEADKEAALVELDYWGKVAELNEGGNVTPEVVEATESVKAEETAPIDQTAVEVAQETQKMEEVAHVVEPAYTEEEIADAQAFVKASSANTTEAYQEYLDNYPEGAYRNGARGGIWMIEGTNPETHGEVVDARNAAMEVLMSVDESKPTGEVVSPVDEKQPLRDRAQEWTAKTGIPVMLIETEAEVTNEDARKALKEGRDVTGWFEAKSGAVALYMPHLHSAKDVDLTYIHEVVAHKGLRALMGDKFDALCDKVWESMSEDARSRFLDYVGEKFNSELERQRAAADEYMAFIAEGVDLTEADKTVWDKIVEFFREFVESFGTKLTDAEIEMLIKASYANLKNMQETSSGEGTRFSKKVEEVNEKFNNELQQQIDGTLPEGHIYQLGMPSPKLLAAEIDNLPIELPAWNLLVKSKKDYKSQHPYNLSDVKDLVRSVHNPIAVFDSEEQNGKKVILTELKDKKNRNFIAVLDIRRRGGRNYVEINSVISLYPKDSAIRIAKWFDSEKAGLTAKGEAPLLKWADKNKTLIWLSSHSSDVNAAGLSYKRIANIVSKFEKTNTESEKSASDGTKFRKVTPEMDAEYMSAVENGDMETAERLVKEAAKMAMPDTKIVDEDGYPMVVYHRTPNEFTIFDPEKIGESTDAGAFGSGFYLSPADFGPLYGKNLMPLFVNLKNPLMLNDANAFETKEPFYGEDYLWGKEQAENFNAWVKENGYDGVWYENNGRDEIIAFESNQIKSADAVTYDDNGNVIPLSERFNEEESDIRFRVANENQEIFVSNARKAVEEIKQEKATPEQWLAMIKKNGGLKAGEDKWMGLSEWLENSESKSLTKQEVLDFVNENAIKIEEVGYSQFGYGMMDEAAKKLEAETKEIGWDAMQEKYPGIEEYFEYYNGEVLWNTTMASIGEYEDFVLDNKIVYANPADNAINESRESYTTEGLERKREIALVVPTVEPYNKHDEIHFGDAGNGRAVAWVRFGETTDSEGNRVLVIDEIQSKRHQDGREKGYKDTSNLTAERQENGIWHIFNNGEFVAPVAKWNANTEQEAIEYYAKDLVPSAPFEKNWQELAMKRMLRLAAEEGFDKVAWTTGEQQAERYNIAKVVSHIECEKVGKNGNKGFSMGLDYKFIVDPNGIVVSSKDEYIGKSIADIVGKPLANKMLEMQEGDTISGDGLRIGGEGMKGFYDKMLPSFVSKYTKKWGAKVGEVEMPSLEQNNVMHSVDVTPEMKESVMEGQTMFRFTDADRQAIDFRRTHKGSANIVVIDTDRMTADLLAQGFNVDEIVLIREIHKKGGFGFYDVNRNTIYLLGKDLGKEQNDKTFWHESAHKAVADLDIPQEVMDEFYSMPSKKFRRWFEKKAKNFYEPEDYAEELIAYYIEDVKDSGNHEEFMDIMGVAPENAERFVQIVEPIINYINYGRRRVDTGTEGSYRQMVRETMHDSSVETLPRGEKEGARLRDTRFHERESIDDIPTQPLTLVERVKNSLLEAAAKNKENLQLRADALRTYGRDVANVLKLMGKQREYDKSTVDTLMKLAKMYFKHAQLLGEVTPYEVTRIMGALNRAVGKRNITAEANTLMNILLDAHAKALNDILEKAEKIKAKKVNAAGVEVMGSLDKYAQETIGTYRDSKGWEQQVLDESIIDSANRLAEAEDKVREALGLSPVDDVDAALDGYVPATPKAENAIEVYRMERARFEGFDLAREYRENVHHYKTEISQLNQELKDAGLEVKKGNIDRRAYNELKRSIEDAIMQSKAEMIDGYHGVISRFTEDVRGGRARAKQFVQEQVDRARDIQHNANSDMEGNPANVQGAHPDKWNGSVPRLFMSAMPTFQNMLKKFGEKAVDGKGYLYTRFMPQATQAADKEFRGKVSARLLIEAKLKGIYDKKMSIEKFMNLSRKHGVTISYKEGGVEKSFDLNKGQMLYIYMVNKMTDGQMKLRKMGITEELVADIAERLDPEMVRFADWAQNELLTDLRGKYNEVHERMFGAPMASIDNYFPLKIKKEARGEKVDNGRQDAEEKPSTVTGSIIKRTKNATAIDLSADAMSVLIEHIDNMEHWAAFAEFNRDLNTLLNYRHFQNQAKGMTTIRYGSGDVLWKNFQKVAAIASGEYRPKTSEVDKAVMNIAKGITRSKINFRLYTAVKQLLSAPAFWNEAGFMELMKTYRNPWGSFKWAKENLPGFKERWEGRTMGNEKLMPDESDWKVWRNKFVENATKWGMTPNAAIDAMTVAQGARAVYLTKLQQFKKAGFSHEQANAKALQAAAEAYNESQQSSEGAYLAPIQKDGTVASAILTTFKNSNFGYTRKTAQAVSNILRKMHKGYKEETIAFMAKKLEREGLTPEQAKAYATKIYKKSKYKDVVDVAMFCFGLNLLWELGGVAIYLMAGDDDETKEKMRKEAALRGALGVLNGIPGGETIASGAMAVAAGDANLFRLPELVAVGDVRNLVKVLDTDMVKGVTDLINLLTAAGIGVNPQVITDLFVAIDDFDSEEFGMFVLRAMAAPTSQTEQLEVDKAMEDNGKRLEEIAAQYVEYKKKRQTPLTGWMYTDEGEQKAMERYAGRFDKMLDERLEKVVEDTDEYQEMYEHSNPYMKEKLSKMRKAYLEGDKEVTFEKLETAEVVNRRLFGENYKDTNVGYFNLSTSEDEDAAYLIDEKLKELEPIHNEARRRKSEDYNSAHAEELELYRQLNGKKNAVANWKKQLKVNPTEEAMNEIRRLRNEAIDLINHE